MEGPLPLGAWPGPLLSSAVGQEFSLSFGQNCLLEPLTGAATQEAEASKEMDKIADRPKEI